LAYGCSCARRHDPTRTQAPHPLAALTLAVAGTSCIAGVDGSDGGDDGLGQDPGGKADSIFGDGPLYLTGAFDGSKRFGMWVDSMEFARYIGREYGKRLRLTLLHQHLLFDETTTGSAIGRAVDRDEALVRIALCAADHQRRARDRQPHVRTATAGLDVEQWRAEFTDFHRNHGQDAVQPDPGADGSFVFRVARHARRPRPARLERPAPATGLR